jgi:hypothetical protein
MPAPLKQDLENYQSFQQLDGTHPWMQLIPTGFVGYKVRELNSGKVTYFNYVLAKEMGLIAADHPHLMNPDLERELIKTFSIQIINEYDELSQRRFDQRTIKPNPYMASRYLQLQHSNKQGKTSGDGRGIWNGQVNFRGRSWDVSSRGTGVTCLAPGAVEANRPLKTGTTDFGYGCGQAEVDELYGAAIQAELMYLQGVHTERMLCVVDLGKGLGIGVRAAPTLFRPAHFFIYLKQSRLQDLKTSIDYLIKSQEQNRNWIFKSKKPAQKYFEMAELIAKDFAQFAARCDVDYIFAWLDWDGDNVLAQAGIIDYGSIRQLGIRHDQYRYDDIQRYSTNLNEQKQKARQIVELFVQIADYLTTGKKKNIKEFAKHPVSLLFDQTFISTRADRVLYNLGFTPTQRKNILNEKNLFQAFDRQFSYFERAKISGKTKKVADGVNHPALFNMSNVLRALPEYLLKNEGKPMPEQEFYQLLISKFAKRNDTKLRPKHSRHIQQFQELYTKLLQAAAGKEKPQKILARLSERAKKINREDKITGNALIQVVEEIMTASKKGLSPYQMQNIIDQIIMNYLDMPEVQTSRYFPRHPRALIRPDLISKIFSVVHEYREDI